MSQADETFEELEKPKRVSRKRVPKVVEEDSIVTLVPQKRPTRNKMSVEGVGEKAKNSRQTKTQKVASPDRKAPTPIAATKESTKTLRRQTMVFGVLILLGVSASAIVGFTDKGPINVEKTIAERNDRISRGEIQGEVVPVQNTPQVPNGGMVGLGTGGSENVASSTAATASTTSPSNASTTSTVQDATKEAAAQAAASSSQQSR